MRKYQNKSNNENIYKQSYLHLGDDKYANAKRKQSNTSKASSRVQKVASNRAKGNKRAAKKGLNIYQKRRLGALLTVVLLIMFLVITVNLVKSKKIPAKVSFLLNNEIIDLKNPMHYVDNIAYISKEDAIALFDNTMYYNQAEKELITTYNTHIAVLREGEGYMSLNDSNISMNGILKELENDVYLPLTDLQIVYDLEFEYSKQNNRVIASSTKEEKKQATLKKNASVKEGSGLFSKTLEKLKQGDTVVIIEDAGGKKIVRTANGNIGYISNSKLGTIETIRTKMEEDVFNYNYMAIDDVVNNYDEAVLVDNCRNAVVPMFFSVTNGGIVVDRTNSRSQAYVNFKQWCEDNEVSIWAGVELDSEVSKELMTYPARNSVIQELYNNVMEYGYQGITIDFDRIDDINSFNRFLIEIKPKFKESGLKVIVRMNNSFDDQESTKINNIADLTI